MRHNKIGRSSGGGGSGSAGPQWHPPTPGEPSTANCTSPIPPYPPAPGGVPRRGFPATAADGPPTPGSRGNGGYPAPSGPPASGIAPDTGPPVGGTGRSAFQTPPPSRAACTWRRPPSGKAIAGNGFEATCGTHFDIVEHTNAVMSSVVPARFSLFGRSYSHWSAPLQLGVCVGGVMACFVVTSYAQVSVRLPTAGRA